MVRFVSKGKGTCTPTRCCAVCCAVPCRQVVVNYVAMTPEGRVFENSLEKQPFDIRVGAGQVLPGLDEGLLSMKVSTTGSFPAASCVSRAGLSCTHDLHSAQLLSAANSPLPALTRVS